MSATASAREEASLRSNRSVADRIAQAFHRHGVSIVFGQSIPTAFHWRRQSQHTTGRLPRRECGGIMADGYARVANRVSVVTAQNGPAATLLVPPLAEALKASSPVVALVQEVPAALAGKNAFQEFDHFRLFDSVAKWVGRIDQQERVDDYVDMAFTIAASGRPGPAVLLAPADVLGLPAGGGLQREAALGAFPLDRCVADPHRAAEAADLLCRAKSPLVVAGGGVHLSAAAAALAEIQEACSLPVATTVMGKGAVDETHPLSLGVIGYFMGPGSRTHEMRRDRRGRRRHPVCRRANQSERHRRRRYRGGCSGRGGGDCPAVGRSGATTKLIVWSATPASRSRLSRRR